ncbi:hypothetical protein ACROYT_G042072 [Oculina patagonica]
MAFCEYAEKVGGQCGSSAEHPANSQCIAIEKCDKDIRGHLKTFAGGFADSTLKSEAELLLARADRAVLWRIMRSYSIPEKIVKMVKVMYSGSECAVTDGSGVYDWFEIKTGVKQGCCVSGFLFLLVVDWVMRKTTEHGNTGIRWKFNNFLEDLDFADDLALISSSGRHIQAKVSNLERYAKMTGLRINTAKTMMMSWNNPAGRNVQIDGKELEEVSKFVYLGGTVTQEGGSDEDIKSRLGKARAAFSKLRNIWKSSQLKLKTKLKIFKSNVVSVLLYGCETWRMT